MATLGFNFDASQEQPLQTFDVLPAGKYLAQAVKSEIRQPRNGDGNYISYEFEVVEGDAQGRRLWVNITTEHSNEKAVDMGRRKLAAFCNAAGVIQLADTEQLHFIPVVLDVTVRPERTDNGTTYPPRNEVRNFEAAPGGFAAPQAAPAPKPSSNGGAAKAGNPTAPWRNRAAA